MNLYFFIPISNRKNPTEFQELFLYDLNGLLLSNYDFTLPTKIYAPGWNNEGAIAEPTKDGNFLSTLI